MTLLPVEIADAWTTERSEDPRWRTAGILAVLGMLGLIFLLSFVPLRTSGNVLFQDKFSSLQSKSMPPGSKNIQISSAVWTLRFIGADWSFITDLDWPSYHAWIVRSTKDDYLVFSEKDCMAVLVRSSADESCYLQLSGTPVIQSAQPRALLRVSVSWSCVQTQND